MKVRKMPYYVNGQKLMSEKFYAVFADHNGKICRLPLFESRKAADSAANKIEELVDLRAANATLSPELSRWVESMPPEIRDRLAEYGILSMATAASGRSLLIHLEGEFAESGKLLTPGYRQHLEAKENTPDYINLTVNRVRRVLEGCGFVFWTDISAEKVQHFLAGLRSTSKRFSKASYNYHLQAFRMFADWMVKNGRASGMPLAHLEYLDTRNDRRHDRVYYTVEEVRWLLSATEKAPHRFKMSGPERALLYHLAVGTGLRAGAPDKGEVGEIGGLLRSSFVAAGDRFSVTVRAGYAKNSREETLLLPRELSQSLQAHLTNKLPSARAFNLPHENKIAEMVRADLADARQAWLDDRATADERQKREATTFLCYKDDAGRCRDFHAFRHTYCVWVLHHLKADVLEAQRLMRVSSLAIVQRYAKSFKLSDREAEMIEKFPNLTAPPTPQMQKATGTDGPAGEAGQQPSPKRLCHCALCHLGAESGGETAESGGEKADVVASAKKPCFAVISGDSPANSLKAEVGFEPTNNGFAIRPLSPLGYSAALFRQYRRFRDQSRQPVPSLASQCHQ